MKKFYLPILSLLFLAFQPLSAQITLSTANNMNVGNVFTSVRVNPNNFTIGAGGTDLTWDYANLLADQTVITKIVDPSTLSNSDRFPMSNIVATDDQSQAESYFYTSNDAQGFYGAVASTAIGNTYVIYTDPQDWLRFPMQFGDQFMDTFSGTVTTSALFNRSGTAMVSADAYGTLITPSGTYDNVLRIATVMDYGDDVNGVPILDYDETRYLWYDATTGFPLMAYSDLITSGSSTKSLSYLDASSVTTRSPLAVEMSMEVFPNPSADWIHIDYVLEEKEMVEIRLSNLVGKEVLNIFSGEEQMGSKNRRVDLSHLSNGTYFVQMTVGDRLATHKVLVQH